MKAFLRLLAADFQKIRNTPMLWIHIMVPSIGVILFVTYYSFSNWNTVEKVVGYIEVLSITFPLLIGIITAMAVDQEALAGNFQELLTARSKQKSFFSKLCMLLLLAFGSILIAVGGFAFGFEFLVHQNTFSIVFYGKLILILFLSQIFLYLLHILCSFRFGTGASIGLGIAESLVSALMLTGYGEGVWKWIPCTWAGRLCDYYISGKTITMYINEFQRGASICLIMTVLLFAFGSLWFHYFEGRNEN